MAQRPPDGSSHYGSATPAPSGGTPRPKAAQGSSHRANPVLLIVLVGSAAILVALVAYVSSRPKEPSTLLTLAAAQDTVDVRDTASRRQVRQVGKGPELLEQVKAKPLDLSAPPASTSGNQRLSATSPSASDIGQGGTDGPTEPAQPPTGAFEARTSATHTVRPGETLYGLATRYNTTTEVLTELNDFGDEGLQTGQSLIVPLRGVHTVAQGEGLTSIARRHNVTVSALRTANGLTGNDLRVGQTLIIPR